MSARLGSGSASYFGLLSVQIESVLVFHGILKGHTHFPPPAGPTMPWSKQPVLVQTAVTNTIGGGLRSKLVSQFCRLVKIEVPVDLRSS